jgi:hypothetical protein
MAQNAKQNRERDKPEESEENPPTEEAYEIRHELMIRDT